MGSGMGYALVAAVVFSLGFAVGFTQVLGRAEAEYGTGGADLALFTLIITGYALAFASPVGVVFGGLLGMVNARIAEQAGSSAVLPWLVGGLVGVLAGGVLALMNGEGVTGDAGEAVALVGWFSVCAGVSCGYHLRQCLRWYGRKAA